MVSCGTAGKTGPNASVKPAPQSYSPPELQTKKWNHYLYTGTTSLIAEKKYDEALTRLVWFWDHILEHQPAMYGVRLSFCLGIWKDLGEAYPPALLKLKQIRDNAEEKAAHGDTNAFAEASSINETLGESKRMIAFFKKLDQTQPQLAKKMWFSIDRTLIENGEYALVLKYGPGPEEKWSKLQETIKKELSPEFARKVLSHSPAKKTISPADIKQFQKRMVGYFKSMQVEPLIKLCNACGKKALATEIETTFRKLSKVAE